MWGPIPHTIRVKDHGACKIAHCQFESIPFTRSAEPSHVRQYPRHAVTVTTAGESHGPALVAIVDGCPPGLPLDIADLQRDLDRRKPGTSRHTTQRQEADEVEILSGVFEGVTTGTPIGLLIRNTDQKSKDYSAIKDLFRPAHADYAYHHKYGLRDYRGGGRSSARETAMRVRPAPSPRSTWPPRASGCVAT